MRRILTAIALLTLISVSACSGDDPADAADTLPSAPAVTVPAVPSPSVDALAKESCRLLAEASAGDEGALLVAGTVEKIAETADASENTGLRVAGQQLRERRDAVLDEILAGSGDEAVKKVEMATAAIQMQTVCIEAGFSNA